MADPAIMFATRRRVMDAAARALRGGSILWQIVVGGVLVVGLQGDHEPLPAAGESAAVYAYLALLVCVVVLALILLPYRRNRERQLIVLARAMGGQAGIGSVLVFSIAFASSNEREVLAAASIGLYLLLSAAVAVTSTLLSEAFAYHRALDERHRAEAGVERILAAIAALTADRIRAEHRTI